VVCRIGERKSTRCPAEGAPHESVSMNVAELAEGAAGAQSLTKSPSNPFTRADHAARFRRELERRWPAARCDEIVDLSRRLVALPDMMQVTALLA
jgi:hypothetical protein